MTQKTTTRNARRAARAFTLIEMMVVIFILGVLVAMIVAVSSYVMDEAARRETESTQAMVLNIIDAFRDEFEKYPPDNLDQTDSDDPGAGATPDPLSPLALMVALRGGVDAHETDDYAENLYRYLYGENTAPNDAQCAALAARVKRITNDRLMQLPEDAIEPWDRPGETWHEPVFKDGWGIAMRYSRDGGMGNRPVVISAGADHRFGWDDEGFDDDESKTTDNIRSDGR